MCATVVGCGLGFVTCGIGITACYSSLKKYWDPSFESSKALDNVSCVSSFANTSFKGAVVEGGVSLGLCMGRKVFCKPVVSSCDPNEIQGPEGYGDEGFVSQDEDLPFTIFYENDPVFATAPAQRVVVRQQLDSNLDPSTFRLTGFGFQNSAFDVPAGLTNYTTRLSTAAEIGVDVNITFGLDVVTNELIWVLQSVDPATGLPPMEALAGFLPVNDSTGVGEGFVSYTIRAKQQTVTGDVVRAQANIFFDTNAPILTNETMNTIDAAAPTLVALSDAVVEHGVQATFQVSAQDDEGGSGLRGFDVWMSVDSGEFTIHSVDNDPNAPFVFEGEPGKAYCLVPVLRDNVDNRTLIDPQNAVCFTTEEDEVKGVAVYSLQATLSGQG